MVVGKILDYNTEDKTYFIQPERLPILTNTGNDIRHIM